MPHTEETEQEPCDVVSRQAVLEQINCWIGSGEYRYTNATHYLTERVKRISSVMQKSGKWIAHSDGGIWIKYYECSECERGHETPFAYCPNCGAKMESEEQTE